MDASDTRRPRRRGALALSAAAVLAALPLVGGAGSGTEDPSPGAVTRRSAAAAIPRLPLEVNERVRYWMERFRTDQRSSFEYFLTREGIYGSLIREKLRERGMPEELIYLAMIESGFSAAATSDVAAVGLWQFMGPTARQYGLRVDHWIDERRDPVRATDAALDYLQWLHDRYESWYLAAAAYNAGPGRVDRALRRGPQTATADADGEASPGDEDLYWEIQHDFPPETREHVPRMIAATLLARDAGRNGFEIEPSRPYEFDRVFVPGATSLSQVASAVGADPALLRQLNPQLILGMTPPGAPFALRVPIGTTHRVVAALGGGPWGQNARADDD